ncbi:MAG TPA: hypothetical protein VGW40_11185 [Allosphingosinicella sp.]|nr:hypothetical protein [Allosphingosinicella sp.]
MTATRLRLTRGRVTPGTWRRHSRFWRMIGSPMIWPAMGALALAVGFGVQLGESAVREIDPVFFQGPAPPAIAVEPAAAAPATSAYSQAYGWEAGNAARLAASGIDYPYAPTPVPVALPAAAPAQREAEPLSLAPWPPGQVAPRPEVERYLDYPIEEKVPDEPVPAEQDTPDEDAAVGE